MRSEIMIIQLVLAILITSPLEAGPSIRPESDTHVIHVVDWEGGQLPPIYERSDQLPLSHDDVVALTASGFEAEEIVRLVTERRFVGDASAAALIRMKDEGIASGVLRAISRHALPPTRMLRISLQIGLEGNSPDARGRYLYVIIPDGDVERILTADLGEIVSRKSAVQVDHTDPLIPRTLREIHVHGTVPVVNDGPRDVRIVSSKRPDIWGTDDIPADDLKKVHTYPMDVPTSSLNRDCRIRLRYRQDPLLPHVWEEVGARFQCEWN